jgi:hypothetical protein
MEIISREEAKKQKMFHYFNGKPCRKGHLSQKYVSNMGCVECRNIKTKSLENRKISKEKYEELGTKYVKSMWWRAKKRSEKSGVNFDIRIDDIVIPDVCPVFGFKFEVGNGKGPTDKSPSLDRIDNSKGYVKGNIQVISFKANKMKSDCNVDDVEKLLCFMKLVKD